MDNIEEEEEIFADYIQINDSVFYDEEHGKVYFVDNDSKTHWVSPWIVKSLLRELLLKRHYNKADDLMDFVMNISIITKGEGPQWQ